MNKFGKHETKTIPRHIVDAMDREMWYEQPVELYTSRKFSGVGTERLKMAALDNLKHKVMYAPVTKIMGAS